jgi:isoamylase
MPARHFAFRGLENEAYYLLEHDRSRYANYTGTGNTLNANQPIVRRMILDSLRYWSPACMSTVSGSISPRF